MAGIGVNDSLLAGMAVDYTDQDDPVLARPDGSTVDTWRENHPMRSVLARFDYADKDDQVVGVPDPLIVGAAGQPAGGRGGRRGAVAATSVKPAAARGAFPAGQAPSGSSTCRCETRWARRAATRRPTTS
jgi:hypothetical protein